MKTRILGKTGISVSEVGLGTWEMSGDVYGKKDDNESIYAIHTALDHNINYIDTAADYGLGHCEEVIGKALKQRRSGTDNIIISTKVMPKCVEWSPSPEREIDDFFPAEWIYEQCEASLQRLKVEKIDILFLHTWSPSWGHHTEWFGAMSKLKAEGKIRAIGISISDDRIAEANVHIAMERADVIMCVYNIFQQEPQYSLFPLTQKHNVAIVARSPFNAGALTGTWTRDMHFVEGDWRSIWPEELGERGWLDKQVTMADIVKPIVQSKRLNFVTTALKFILMNSSVSLVIPGSSNPQHIIANASASDAPELSQQLMSELKKLWLDRKVYGFFVGSKT